MEEQNTENAEKEVSVKEENIENTKTQSASWRNENAETKEDENTENSKKEVADEKQEEEKTEQPIEETVGETKDEDVKTGNIYPDVVPGANVKIYQKIKEQKGKEEKERIQIFEGLVLARKGGSSAGATITVQKICKGGFEVKKIFPLHLPTISKIEVGRQAKVRKAKLSFLKRTYKKKLKY
ncbi:MAG: 50S ribosomal protein L19 [bacterium]